MEDLSLSPARSFGLRYHGALLVILRPDAMLIPALCVIIVALLLLRARLEGSRTEAEEEVV